MLYLENPILDKNIVPYVVLVNVVVIEAISTSHHTLNKLGVLAFNIPMMLQQQERDLQRIPWKSIHNSLFCSLYIQREQVHL
ncbi:hypothetical protein E2C01_029071 [Portunus trituberculatus]|uniref:Uncharacterized protein n=1 Tax=Portunus trituberculatus TaxID=210409 RepID=A0A5B7EQJ0_PORTR|nr:hypothetical protein [Portunus trituberculatus]